MGEVVLLRAVTEADLEVFLRRFVGYWFGRAFWGRGVGTWAMTLFLGEEPVRPLYADPFHGNTASVRLLEKHGFEQSGTVRHGDDEHLLLVLR
ncbi:GNAT family N-acetyltransferase [Nonomuraea sp. MG754425]|uniref:GNAT family N-acetyltransferase n=1 Tax=Nonomuraea sp. MG754425 TaxID=2570319 RepID=UPI001F24FF73|nr:GNAT family N-acetyltransferase [Nonomuraea sp. MG754425]MCF6470788.1 GNAT family N-acetyltransferase [Nonomuraea sp. MG754425]